MATAEPVDLEAVVLKWARQLFDMTKNKEQARIPKEHIQFTVNWKRVRFNHGEPSYTDTNKPPSPKSIGLFKTSFTNRTGQDQEYSFRTQRSTRSTCEIVVEQTYTVGYEMNISLKTPCEVFEANAGFHRELSVVNAHGQVVEEELSWEVDTMVKVPSMRKATAELVISEDKFSGNFTLTTEISGTAIVTVTNTRDNNSLVMVCEGNIAEVIRAMKEKETGLKPFTLNKNSAKITTKGNCTFNFAVEQHVALTQTELGQ